MAKEIRQHESHLLLLHTFPGGVELSVRRCNRVYWSVALNELWHGHGMVCVPEALQMMKIPGANPRSRFVYLGPVASGRMTSQEELVIQIKQGGLTHIFFPSQRVE
jgi:hypothetical protein